jgi:hypothetical protein
LAWPALAAVAAVGALLLAADVLRLGDALRSDDVRFRATPERSGLWEISEVFPAGGARALLGMDDDIAYRRALLAFQRGRPWGLALRRSRLLEFRDEAQDRLASILASDADPARRSAAANLLGVLSFVAATQERKEEATSVRNAAKAFRDAIALDPGNDDAKHNLELALGSLAESKIAPHETASPAESRRGRGSRAGEGSPEEGKVGGGY